MATIFIDQKPYEIDPQKNVLEAALSHGLNLPYFCWHPALGSVGSCRQCAVQQFADEKDENGRMVMACMTQVKDGARFSIDHPNCSSFRKNVIEWMMINHPHDCPVCDEGGECHLQDMTVMTGHENRRYRFNKRTFRNQNLGPFINHEMNRCITCYRCVRFYKDVAGGDDLSAFRSSGKVYFGRYEEGTLENEFSGNLVEICPTGVFTDKVFHKRYTRKWDLETAPSICQLCSLGCNISPGERTGELRRIQNRYNHDVNGYFICDRGRFGHEFVNSKDRVTTPLIRKEKAHVPASLHEAIATVKELISKSKNVIGIGSPRASLEANFMLKTLVGAEHFYDGLAKTSSEMSQEIATTLKKGVVSSASLKDVRDADAVLIVAEDITNTAPMITLAIKQAVMRFREKLTERDLNIAGFNDAAVRDYARNVTLPVFSAGAFQTAHDNFCESITLHPSDLMAMFRAMSNKLLGKNSDVKLSETTSAWLEKTVNALLHAERPVIISGASLGEKDLLRLAVEIACRLDQKKQGAVKLFLVDSDVNSVGLQLLKPQPLWKMDRSEVDVAVVLENNLSFRLGQKPFAELAARVKNLVVIDYLMTATTKAATVVLPSLSFAECSGTVVSSEGRLQRFVSVFKSNLEADAAFRLLNSCNPSSQISLTVDEICQNLAPDLDVSLDVFTQLYDGNEQILRRGIPRQTTEFSGRTALYANKTMHEPKPANDPDSPFAYSMEGARKKIPLPLISSYWEPQWNSVQAFMKGHLGDSLKEKSSGVRLFEKRDGSRHSDEVFSSEKKVHEFPQVYVLPRFAIFGSEERANFAASLRTRIPSVFAYISEEDASRHGFSAGAKLVLDIQGGRYSLVAKTEKNLAAGILLLPFGLVDNALFYQTAQVQVVSEDRV